MRKRNLLYIGLCIATISMGFTGCSSTKKPAVQNSTESEKIEKDQETIDYAMDLNEIKTSKLYEDRFQAMYGQIGDIDFDSFLESLNDIADQVEATKPTDEEAGRVLIKGEDGTYVQYVFSPDINGKPILSQISYEDDLSEVIISNGEHKDSLRFYTYMMTRTPKKMEVNNEEELRKFAYGLSKEYAEAYKEKVANNKNLEVKIDAEPIYDEKGLVSFKVNTNLPDKANLVLTLMGGEYQAMTKVDIENGTATSNKFHDNGSSLASGTYTLIVSMSTPVVQAQEVQDVVGVKGEFMTGKYVEKLSDDDDDSFWVYAEIPVELQ